MIKIWGKNFQRKQKSGSETKKQVKSGDNLLTNSSILPLFRGVTSDKLYGYPYTCMVCCIYCSMV